MDGSAISQGAWDRNDFPLEKFFQDDADESTLNRKPTGAEPEATSSQVQKLYYHIYSNLRQAGQGMFMADFP